MLKTIWAPHQGIPGVSSMSGMACEGSSSPQTGQSGVRHMSALYSERMRLYRGWACEGQLIIKDC